VKRQYGMPRLTQVITEQPKIIRKEWTRNDRLHPPQDKLPRLEPNIGFDADRPTTYPLIRVYR